MFDFFFLDRFFLPHIEILPSLSFRNTHTSASSFAMQRPTYGQSPPLHHPVPQHVSTVPQLRSPPPPVPSQPQSQGYAASPYQQQGSTGPGQAGHMFGQYGNFINDPTAQLASQFGQTAFRHGQEYFEQNVRALLPARFLLFQETRTSPVREENTFV